MDAAGAGAAVDDQRGAGDEVGQRRGEQQDGVGDVVGGAAATTRDGGAGRLAVALGQVPAALFHIDVAGQDAVDADVVRRQLQRHRLGQQYDRRLRGAV